MSLKIEKISDLIKELQAFQERCGEDCQIISLKMDLKSIDSKGKPHGVKASMLEVWLWKVLIK